VQNIVYKHITDASAYKKVSYYDDSWCFLPKDDHYSLYNQ